MGTRPGEQCQDFWAACEYHFNACYQGWHRKEDCQLCTLLCQAQHAANALLARGAEEEYRKLHDALLPLLPRTEEAPPSEG